MTTTHTAYEIKIHRVRAWHGYDAKWQWISEIRCDGKHVEGFGPFDAKSKALAAAEEAMTLTNANTN
jgi:hypothetical protein